MTDLTYLADVPAVLLYIEDQLKQRGYYLTGAYDVDWATYVYELHKPGAEVFVKSSISYTTLRQAVGEYGVIFADSLIDKMIEEFESRSRPSHPVQSTQLEKSNEQKLVDLCFELVLTATQDKKFCKKSNEEKAAWVADQLRKCGFDTKPVGCSWGVLKNTYE